MQFSAGLTTSFSISLTFALSSISWSQVITQPQVVTQPEVVQSPEAAAESLFKQAMRELQNGLHDSSIQSLTKAYELVPTNKKYALFLVDGLAKHSKRLAARKATMQQQAAKVARGILKNKTELQESERDFIGDALYEAALMVVNSKERDEHATIAALAEAFDSGFSRYELIEKDISFDWIRDHLDFQKLVRESRVRYIEKLKKTIKRELDETKPFAFDFNLKAINGEPVKLTDYKTNILIVDFWATWCPPCRDEVSQFAKLFQMHGTKGLRIVGINYEQTDSIEEAISRINKFKETTDVPYPLLIGDDATKKQIPNFQVFPTTLFIDQEGDVRLVLAGPKSFLKMDTVVEMLLSEEK